MVLRNLIPKASGTGAEHIGGMSFLCQKKALAPEACTVNNLALARMRKERGVAIDLEIIHHENNLPQLVLHYTVGWPIRVEAGRDSQVEEAVPNSILFASCPWRWR